MHNGKSTDERAAAITIMDVANDGARNENYWFSFLLESGVAPQGKVPPPKVHESCNSLYLGPILGKVDCRQGHLIAL